MTTGLLITGALVAGVWQVSTHSPVDSEVPVTLVHRLAAQPGEKRVLNHYDAGGFVMAFGSSQTQVAIDSRSDMYGRERIARYFILLHAQPGWREILDEYAPTDALLKKEDGLNRALPALGWTRVAESNRYVLWHGPGSDPFSK